MKRRAECRRCDCRHQVLLRSVAVPDEPITTTSVALVMWTAAWSQFIELADPIARIHMPNLCDFFKVIGREAVQLMGATCVGHHQYLQQGSPVGDTTGDLNRTEILNEIRNQMTRIARWRCELSVLQANAVDRCLGALAASGENLYDYIPELFIQSITDLSTSMNAAINDQLTQMYATSVPLRTITVEPSGGSSGTASTMEQAYRAYRDSVRSAQSTSLEDFT